MAGGNQSSWTEERLETLKDLWAKGLSITQIGLKIGVSRNAVVGKVHRMGLPKRQSPIARSSKPPMPKRRKSAPIGLTEWDRNKCCWPIGDPKSDNFHFCGDKPEEGRPYCHHHCTIAYTTMKENAA